MKVFKNIFPYTLALALTFFGFLCLSLPYFNIAIIEVNIFYPWVNFPLSGYGALSLWNFGWSGILISIFQLFELLLMITILVFAIIGLFSEVFTVITGRELIRCLPKIIFILFLVNLCLDFVILIFVIVFVVVNHFTINAGLIVKLVFDTAAFVGLFAGKYFFSEKPVIKSRPLSSETEFREEK